MHTFPIIRKLGGPEAVHAILADRINSGYAVRMWMSRGQIPSWAIMRLMGYCEVRDIPYSSFDFYPQRRPSRRATRDPQGAVRNAETQSAAAP